MCHQRVVACMPVISTLSTKYAANHKLCMVPISLMALVCDSWLYSILRPQCVFFFGGLKQYAHVCLQAVQCLARSMRGLQMS